MILAWIPAHIGIAGNEIVDQLAKQGTEEEWTRELKITYGDLKEEYKKETSLVFLLTISGPSLSSYPTS